MWQCCDRFFLSWISREPDMLLPIWWHLELASDLSYVLVPLAEPPGSAPAFHLPDGQKIPEKWLPVSWGWRGAGPQTCANDRRGYGEHGGTRFVLRRWRQGVHVSSGHFAFSIKWHDSNLKIDYLCNQQSLRSKITSIDIPAFSSTLLQIISLIRLFLVHSYF